MSEFKPGERYMKFMKKLKEKKEKKGSIKKSGTFEGKSNKLGQGGRAAQLKKAGVPGGVIGNLARAAHAAKGQANYHGKKSNKKADGKLKFGSPEWRAKYMKGKKGKKGKHSAKAIAGLKDFVNEEEKEKGKKKKTVCKKHKKTACKACAKKHEKK